jgi:hypothetical protein
MGTKKIMILLLWEKNFEYKKSILLSDVCYDLSLWWHLPNWDIAFKQIKIVKIPKNNLACCFFFLPHILTRYKCVVHPCLQPCTGMVSGLLTFMDNMTCLYHFRFISIAIALQRCIIYVQGLFFNADSTMISIY